jgi:uncharacterized protein (TIGR02996 family)
MFTAEDKPFVLAILANPAELTAWLVYADWLDEHGNATHAEFLRLMARRGQLQNTDLEWYTVEERLQELRAELDPVWVEIFDRPKIENCGAAFRFQCPKQWENLKVTGDPTVRHCDACDKSVHYCHTLPEAQSHARQGHCVAVQLGVLRYPDDLKPRYPDETFEDAPIAMGDFDADYYPSLPEWATMPAPPTPLTTATAPEPRRPWWKFW